MKKGTGVVRARELQGWTFAKGAHEWLAGVTSGHIKRRWRGKAEPYSETTIPD
jgi:hypothetical protein